MLSFSFKKEKGNTHVLAYYNFRGLHQNKFIQKYCLSPLVRSRSETLQKLFPGLLISQSNISNYNLSNECTLLPHLKFLWVLISAVTKFITIKARLYFPIHRLQQVKHTLCVSMDLYLKLCPVGIENALSIPDKVALYTTVQFLQVQRWFSLLAAVFCPTYLHKRKTDNIMLSYLRKRKTEHYVV